MDEPRRLVWHIKTLLTFEAEEKNLVMDVSLQNLGQGVVTGGSKEQE